MVKLGGERVKSVNVRERGGSQSCGGRAPDICVLVTV
jgi:hypothetical protein